MKPIIETTSEPDPAARDAILAVLVAHNDAAAGRPPGVQPLAILLRDPESGAVIGGLWGQSVYDWLFIQYLAVPEALRGQGLGRELMSRAETVARERGCVGLWLDTFEFQARPFYEKLGYSLFGQIEDFPRGSRRYFLHKRL